MIAEIRKHFKEQIYKCDSSFREIKTPYPRVEDLIQSKETKTYALIFNTSQQILGDKEDSMDGISVTLRTYASGSKDKLASFDEGYSNALLIKALMLDISSLNSKEYIKSINGSVVTPGEVSNSQDVYSYETNYIITISYGIGD